MPVCLPVSALCPLARELHWTQNCRVRTLRLSYCSAFVLLKSMSMSYRDRFKIDYAIRTGPDRNRFNRIGTLNVHSENSPSYFNADGEQTPPADYPIY